MAGTLSLIHSVSLAPLPRFTSILLARFVFLASFVLYFSKTITCCVDATCCCSVSGCGVCGGPERIVAISVDGGSSAYRFG